MNITVGTKVRMVKNSGVNKIGELGEVTYVGLKDFRVKTKSSYDDMVNWCGEDDIEIINEQKQIIMKFKVGDKVKINGHYLGSVNRQGDIGEIQEINSTSGKTARVKVKGRASQSNWEELSTLELVTEVETFTVSKEFIKLAHDAACSEWKEKLKKEFPAAFKTVYNRVSLGDRFSCSDFIGGDYILAKTDSNKVLLINLENGNRWSGSEAVTMLDQFDITELEFEKICGGRPEKFTKILK